MARQQVLVQAPPTTTPEPRVRTPGFHMNQFDKDFACMNCCSHYVDLYEHEEGAAEMWTYCHPCDSWTCHPCLCCPEEKK